jgi:hypothetical protein
MHHFPDTLYLELQFFEHFFRDLLSNFLDEWLQDILDIVDSAVVLVVASLGDRISEGVSILAPELPDGAILEGHVHDHTVRREVETSIFSNEVNSVEEKQPKLKNVSTHDMHFSRASKAGRESTYSWKSGK